MKKIRLDIQLLDLYDEKRKIINEMEHIARGIDNIDPPTGDIIDPDTSDIIDFLVDNTRIVNKNNNTYLVDILRWNKGAFLGIIGGDNVKEQTFNEDLILYHKELERHRDYMHHIRMLIIVRRKIDETMKKMRKSKAKYTKIYQNEWWWKIKKTPIE